MRRRGPAGKVVCAAPWAAELVRRRFALSALLLASTVYAWPLAALRDARPVPSALLALSAGAWGAAWLFRRRARAHHAGHLSAARRLGHSAELRGPLWRPWRWGWDPPVVSLSKPKDEAEGVRQERDLPLLRLVEGYLQPPLPPRRSLDVALMQGALAAAGLFASVLGALSPGVQAALGLPLLAAAAWAWDELLRAEAALLYRHEQNPPELDERPSTWLWPFHRLALQRETRDPRRFRRELARILQDEAGLAPGARILEVGAGAGVLWRFAPPELRARWVQSDAEVLACRYAVSRGVGGLWCAADAKRLPAGTGSLDAVVGLAALDSMFRCDLEPFLLEAWRALRPGGVLVHLSDFPDSPGKYIAAEANAFARHAGAGEAVRLDPGRRTLEYLPLAPRARKALEGRARRRDPEGDCLRLVLEGGGGPRAGALRSPRLASIELLAASAARVGFLELGRGPAEEDGSLVAWLVLRQPALEPPA